jgi:hypothetical protein
MLDDRSAAVDPVPAIDVTNAARVADHRGMDVAADDPVDAALPGVAQHRVLEVEYEAAATAFSSRIQ